MTSISYISIKIYIASYRKIHKYIETYFIRHPDDENTCGFGRSFWENGFAGGHCANFKGFCCSSTRHGLSYLKEKGMLEELPDGGEKIRVSPNTLPFIIPPHLKNVSIPKWKLDDRKWLNMYDTTI